MEEQTKDNFLDILIGEKLSSVTFVMDYLQIDFDGNSFTLYIWPVLTIENQDYKYGDTFYRDKLCFLIAKVVAQVSLVDKKEMKIIFETGDRLTLSIEPENPEIIAEIAIFTDTNKKWYVFD